MNQITAINPSEIQTMSSREVAELTGKQHSNIKVSAVRLSEKGTIALQGSKFNHNGNEYTEYLFNKRDSMVLVAQNCPEFTAAIVDRWQELEDQKVSAIPQTYAAALIEAGRLAQLADDQQKVIELQKPAVEFVERFCTSEGNQTFREVLKLANNKFAEKITQGMFRDWLYENRIMYKTGTTWTAYQPHIDSGRFTVSAGVADNDHAYTQCKFTPKGVEYVLSKLASRECV